MFSTPTSTNDLLPFYAVVPVYGHYEYAAKTIQSFFENANPDREVGVLFLDDCFPGGEQDFERWRTELQPTAKKRFLDSVRLERNRQLTYGWNYGIRHFLKEKPGIICVTNSDVVMPVGYDDRFETALNHYDLVGPVTNAPGTEPMQYVGMYSNLYRRDSIQQDHSLVAEELARAYRHYAPVPAQALNGFCLVAKSITWKENLYDDKNAFRPTNPFNSKGHVNPTPLMTLQEYELEKRWALAGLTFGAVHSCYVLHYRSVSRGASHLKGDWLRA